MRQLDHQPHIHHYQPPWESLGKLLNLCVPFLGLIICDYVNLFLSLQTVQVLYYALKTNRNYEEGTEMMLLLAVEKAQDAAQFF